MRFKLPSGRIVDIDRDPVGRDVEKAFSAAGSAVGNPAAYSMALFAQVAEVNGRAVVYEDVRELPHQDVMVIMAWSSSGAEGLIKAGVEVTTDGPVDGGTGVPL